MQSAATKHVPLAAGLVALLGMTACSRQLAPTPNVLLHQDVGFLDETPKTLRNNTPEIIFVTDRALDKPADGRPRYGFARSKSISFGTATVRIGKDLTWDDLVEQSQKRNRNKTLPIEVVAVNELGRFPNTPFEQGIIDGKAVDDPAEVARFDETAKALQKTIADRLSHSDKKNVYIFVHGFNNNFEHATFVMTNIWHFMGRVGVPVIYTWPAGHGGMQGYTYDRESSEFTVYHLRQTLLILAACPEVEKIHLIAHSRGTDVVMTTLRELVIQARAANEDPTRKLKLGNLVLAAPDLDWEVTLQRVDGDRVARAPERVTVYTRAKDMAIGAAESLFDSEVRLGKLDADDLTSSDAEAVEALGNIDFINADVRADMIGHAYFYKNPAVFSDLILLLRDNRPPGAEFGRPLERDGRAFYRITDDYLKP